MIDAPLLVEVRNLRKHFTQGGFFARRRAHVRAVEDVSFTIARGETLGLVGESGCGKTTTGRLLMRLIEPSGGSIRLDGTELTDLPPHEMQARRRDMQLVFQDPYSSLNPRMTLREILREPLIIHHVTVGQDLNRRVDEILRHVGLDPKHAGRYPHEFSGGQRQRIAIARALILQPKLIVCDEPVSALDVSVQAQILNLLSDLKDAFGLSYLFISHDLAVVRHMAARVAVMYLGRIIETAPVARLFEQPAHPYTRALIDSVPPPNPRAKRTEAALTGDVPSPANPPSGCHFHTRCPHAVPICAERAPELSPVALDHAVACHRSGELPDWAPARPTTRSAGQDRIERLHRRFRRETPTDRGSNAPSDMICKEGIGA